MIGLPLVLVLAAVLWTAHKILTSPTREALSRTPPVREQA